MNTILTDDERTEIFRRSFKLIDSRPVGEQIEFIAAIEAAVLAKLAQQEPVAWANPDNMVDATSSFRWIEIGPFTQPVYAHPAPQQADRQRVPDEDSPAVCDAYERIDRFLRNNLGDEDYADYSHDLDLLAATPEAPAQASAVDERAEFEAWVTNQGVALHYEGDGHYGNATVSRWWEAWQARAALAQKGGAA